MWSLIVKKGLPSKRIMRYCCSEFKEQGGKGRMKITDVRSAESVNRAKNAGMIKIIGKPETVQKMAENLGADYELSQAGGLVMNMDNDKNRRLVEHYKRQIEEFERYLKYKNLYIRAFDKMLESHPNKEYHYSWKNGVDVFDWWTGFDSNQLSFFDMPREVQYIDDIYEEQKRTEPAHEPENDSDYGDILYDDDMPF